MPHKNLQVEELLHRELSQIIAREIEMPDQSLITIVSVRSKNNLAQADVFVSVIPDKNKYKVLKIIKKIAPHLQYLLNKRLKTQNVPKINFCLEPERPDTSEVDKLLNQIEENNLKYGKRENLSTNIQ